MAYLQGDRHEQKEPARTANSIKLNFKVDWIKEHRALTGKLYSISYKAPSKH